MRTLKRFSYSNFCYLATELVDLKIHSKKGLYVVEYSKGFAPEKVFEPITLTAEESDKLDELFSELHIDRWNDRYENLNILDGEEWTIKVTFTDGSKREIHGMNARPTRWVKFRALIKWVQEKQMEYELKA